MAETSDRLAALIDRLELLSRQQDAFQKEIAAVRAEVFQLQSEQWRRAARSPDDVTSIQTCDIPIASPAVPHFVHSPVVDPTQRTEAAPVNRPKQPPAPHQTSEHATESRVQPGTSAPRFGGKTSLEKFIGENLINKIGIAVVVIGVAIGAKYAIDNDLISPLTRIVLGYLFGVGLMGVAMKLREKYEDFSAVLLSGAMAIMYFITFAAYSFYGLLPQAAAFGLMVVFTAFTVFAAIKYNRQVIAHIGLVGAYAVPFLLSDGSGRVHVLFSYMAIINAGILIVAFRRYWKPLYYASFGLTWTIYAAWFATSYSQLQHFGIALTFATIFFLIFYAAFLSYKLYRKEKFNAGDIALLLVNSFVFYGFGYAVLSEHRMGSELLGAFTVANAVVHFAVSAVIYRNKLADRNLFFLVSGLVLVFITLAVPVQFQGNWVTMIWVA
ncbi:MAG TPA: DUF2339 domain-containing protein, partial [Chitinophagales bacterium]|nr:DUF2339 domain-containing protein [Chitinophagales bacterium]